MLVQYAGMSEVAWGPEANGARFGLRKPTAEMEAGGTVVLELVCENVGRVPIDVFGFHPGYPRALRVSPPKQDRPWIRVSFGDVNFLHPHEAFVRLEPGASIDAGLDLSFAFDRRGAGDWQVAFAYDPVRAGGRHVPWNPPRGGAAESGIVELVVVTARSLREAGIDAAAEAELDTALLSADPSLVDRLRSYGDGGAAFAARRVARILSYGAESTVGWRALDALTLLGERGLVACRQAREDLPHAEAALAYAEAFLEHRLRVPPAQEHMPFVAMLERLVREPDVRGNLIVSWTAYESEFHGMRRVQIFGNGERIVTSRGPGQLVPTTRRTTIGEFALRSLLESFGYAAVWLLRPLRRAGIPDEPRPSLEIQLALGEPFRRQIIMWNGEWRQGPAAQLADLLDRLSDDTGDGSIAPPPA